MAKPILVMRFPLKDSKNIESISKHWDNSSNIVKEYHILMIVDELIDSMQFECYNTNETEEVKIDDLKERLTILMESALYRIKESNRIEAEQRKQKIKDEEDELKKSLSEQSRLRSALKQFKPNFAPDNGHFSERYIKNNNNE